MRYLIFSIFICLASGAAALKYYTKAGFNERKLHVNTLIRQWGAPEIRSIAPNGNQILIFRSRSRLSYPSASPAIGIANQGGRPVIVSQPPSNQAWPGQDSLVITCTMTVEANRKGYVVSMQSAGSRCPNLTR